MTPPPPPKSGRHICMVPYDKKEKSLIVVLIPMNTVYIWIKVDYTTCLLFKQLTFVPLPLDCPFIHKIISVHIQNFFG